MISLHGELTVRTFSGRYGLFNTGKLSTQIGEFVVKDSTLDQLQEGKYPGQFIVSQIKPSSYVYNGRVIVETRAYLEHMILDDNALLSDDDRDNFGFQEQDPVIEEASSAQPERPDLPNANIEPPSHANSPVDYHDDDPALFDRLWPLGQTVRLDSTCDRMLLRQQVKRLGELGYQINTATQIWSKDNTD